MDLSSNQPIFDESRMAFIAERLAAGQKVRYLKFRGVSMMPMLRQGKDSVELSPLPNRLKKYDLPVYRRVDGQYVMHRIVDVKEDHYICLGDNTLAFETIYPQQMIGVVSAFKRGEKRIEVDATGYRIYCRLWRLTHPVRKLIFKMKCVARRLLKPLRKGKGK